MSDRSVYYLLTILCLIYSSICLPSSNVYVYIDSEFVYRFSNDEPSLWIAYGSFKNEMNVTGWTFVDIQTNAEYPNNVQAYAAGLAEGYLTHTVMNQSWINRGLSDICPKPYSKGCKEVIQFLSENLRWMREQILIHSTGSAVPEYMKNYWEQVGLFMYQTRGLSDGYHAKPSYPRLEIDPTGHWLLQVTEDLPGIAASLGVPPVELNQSHRVFGSGSCSGLIKILPGTRDVFVSHVTWTTYSSMLRAIKRYNLNYRNTHGQFISGYNMSFSSYPGQLFSVDDFYTLSSHMVSMETTIGNMNADLWKMVQPKSVLEGIRVMVANRLANNGHDWARIFSLHNSGTYNNEWMIVDFKQFSPLVHSHIKPGFFTLINQIPGTVKHEDMTRLLAEWTYYDSYNIPYFPEIYNASGWPAMVAKHGNMFSREHAPRANIFRRDQSKVTDMNSMLRLMRYNDYQHDPFSRCNCTPPYSAENAISSRGDLNPVNGTYPLDLLGHRMHGATDVKVTSYSMSKKLQMIAQAGPTSDQQPAFQWSKLSPKDDHLHLGMPDLFDFNPILVKWP